MNDKYAKEISKELKLIRKELQKMNKDENKADDGCVYQPLAAQTLKSAT